MESQKCLITQKSRKKGRTNRKQGDDANVSITTLNVHDGPRI